MRSTDPLRTLKLEIAALETESTTREFEISARQLFFSYARGRVRKRGSSIDALRSTWVYSLGRKDANSLEIRSGINTRRIRRKSRHRVATARNHRMICDSVRWFYRRNDSSPEVQILRITAPIFVLPARRTLNASLSFCYERQTISWTTQRKELKEEYPVKAAEFFVGTAGDFWQDLSAESALDVIEVLPASIRKLSLRLGQRAVMSNRVLATPKLSSSSLFRLRSRVTTDTHPTTDLTSLILTGEVGSIPNPVCGPLPHLRSLHIDHGDAAIASGLLLVIFSAVSTKLADLVVNNLTEGKDGIKFFSPYSTSSRRTSRDFP